jgi:hypothetical protein
MADQQEYTADDLVPGTGFEVVVRDDGTFEVTVYYDWTKRNGPYYDGRGTGKTFTEAASMAIQDAEGELEEDDDQEPGGAPGPWFEAERGGECSRDGCEIAPGDEVRADGNDGWERRKCVEAKT